jgi:hypothetical protein
MYQKDLLKDLSGPHLTKCGWYLDCPKDYTSSFEVSLCESLELGFIKKAIETRMSQGPQKKRIPLKKRLKKTL